MNKTRFNGSQGKYRDRDIKFTKTRNQERTENSIDLMDREDVAKEPLERRDTAPVIPSPPCDGCANFNLCKDSLLSCEAFTAYADDPTTPETSRGRIQSWEVLPRVPNKKLYDKLFAIKKA